MEPVILIVDDERNMRESLKDILEEEGYAVRLSDSGEDALAVIKEDEGISVIISDVRMPGMDGFELLRRVKQEHPEISFIMITAFATPKLAVEAMKQGAIDYISKPFDPEEILLIVRKVVDHRKLVNENIQLKSRISKDFQLEDIIGQSHGIKEIIEIVKQVAPAPSNVLIQGESGTGRELVAKALHYLSERRVNNFVTVNCAAIPETLLESELFGFKKGSFTDAHKDRKGRFEEAHGGTLFLDEIGDMSMPLQAKILRVIQDKEFRKIGDEKSIKSDVRIIAATNKDLSEAISKNEFRKDLFFRINVINISLPPLRERREDIPLLIEHFKNEFNHLMGKQVRVIEEDAIEFMKGYYWPGNIRELENLIERLIIFCPGETVDLKQVKRNLIFIEEESKGIESFIDKYPSFKDAVDNFQILLINRAIERADGHIQKAADQLGISRHALRYQMNKLGLSTKDEDDE